MITELVKNNGNLPASSVGSTGIHYNWAGNRNKGIDLNVILNKNDLNDFFGKMDAADRLHPNATRTTVRAFMKREFIEEIMREAESQKNLIRTDVHLNNDGIAGGFLSAINRNNSLSASVLKYNIEAVVRTNGTVSGCDLVYFGKNAPERVPNSEVLEIETENLKNATGAQTVTRNDAFARVKSNGYTISMLDKNSEIRQSDIETMLALYKEAYQIYTFDINSETIQYMLGNGNRIYLARNDSTGQIASVVIAEKAELELSDGSNVNMYELSDYATFQKDRGNGLITALQILAIEDLRNLDPHSIIYAETRAPWFAVVKSSKQAGMEYGGTLPYHCRIKGDSRNYEYNAYGEAKNDAYESLHVQFAPAA